MKTHNILLQYSQFAILIAGLVVVPSIGFAQDQSKPATVPDAQVEASVLKALAGAADLADQAINTTIVYGTVTLSGTVRDEASRTKAEQLAANTPGVKKVIDELVIESQQQQGQVYGQANPPEYGDQEPDPADRNMAPVSPQNSGQYGDPQAYPPYPQPRYGRPHTRGYYPCQLQPAQKAGVTVVIPAGTLLQVRINQAIDSRRTPPGTAFDGVVLANVIVGNQIAIPRGTYVQGVVADARPGTPLRGRGGISLALTQVSLGSQPYPLVTGYWQQGGYDKTGQTVENTVRLGALGAILGAAAGGGSGALLGAGVGSAAGLGASAATRNGAVRVPAEAILSFRLADPALVQTLSLQEIDRIAATMPPPAQMQGRYAPYRPTLHARVPMECVPPPPAAPAPQPAAAPEPQPALAPAPPEKPIDTCKELRAELNSVLKTEEGDRGLTFHLNSVLFDTDKYTLKPEGRELLDRVAGILKQYPDVDIHVEGYTDSIASVTYNLGLSENSARTVKAYLVQDGVDDARITANGYGKEYPVASNATEEGRAQNRRVDILLGGKAVCVQYKQPESALSTQSIGN